VKKNEFFLFELHFSPVVAFWRPKRALEDEKMCSFCVANPSLKGIFALGWKALTLRGEKGKKETPVAVIGSENVVFS